LPNWKGETFHQLNLEGESWLCTPANIVSNWVAPLKDRLRGNFDSDSAVWASPIWGMLVMTATAANQRRHRAGTGNSEQRSACSIPVIGYLGSTGSFVPTDSLNATTRKGCL
jgi:hypothetical protein